MKFLIPIPAKSGMIPESESCITVSSGLVFLGTVRVAQNEEISYKCVSPLWIGIPFGPKSYENMFFEKVLGGRWGTPKKNNFFQKTFFHSFFLPKGIPIPIGRHTFKKFPHFEPP